MKIIALLVILLIFSVGLSSATSTYNVATNTITVANGINYPWTVYSDVSNSTAFNRTGNESVMTADLSISSGATLYINDETWKFNCSSNGEYGIDNSGTLEINNSTIQPINEINRWWIKSEEPTGGLILNITNSELHGYGTSTNDGIRMVGTTYLIKNNTMYNCMYGVSSTSANTSRITENTIYNVNKTGILVYNTKVDNNTLYNIGLDNSSETYGIFLYGAGPSRIYDNIIRDSTFTAAMMAKESPCGEYLRNDIYGITGIGIYPYYSYSSVGSTSVCNNAISVSGDGIYNSLSSSINSTICNNSVSSSTGTGIRIKDANNVLLENNTVYATVGIHIQYSSADITAKNNIFSGTSSTIILTGSSGNIVFVDSTIISDASFADWYFYYDDTNITVINSKNTSDVYYRTGSSGDLKVYYYADVFVQDSTSNPYNNIIVNINNNIDSSLSAINMNGIDTTSFTSTTDGHIPLPSNTSTSAAIFYSKRNLSGTTYMNHTVNINQLDTSLKTCTAGDSAIQYTWINESVLITPTTGFYRTVPDTYQNTTTITANWKSSEYFNVVAS